MRPTLTIVSVLFLFPGGYASASQSAPASQPTSRPFRIAFAADNGDTGRYQIYTMFSDRSEPFPRRLTRKGSNEMPAFSPDGTKIAFVSNRDGNREIYVMNDDGTDQRRLTEFEESDSQPCWTLASELAFTREVNEKDNRTDIFGVDVRSGVTLRLTKTLGDDFLPSGAPATRSLAFTTAREHPNKFPQELRIYVTKARFLGDWQKPLPLMADPVARQDVCRNPVFSPDGAALVYQRFRSYGSWGTATLWWHQVRTNSCIQLLSGLFIDTVAWTPDGTRLILAIGEDIPFRGSTRLFILDISPKALGEIAMESDPRKLEERLVPLPVLRRYVCVPVIGVFLPIFGTAINPSCAPLR